MRFDTRVDIQQGVEVRDSAGGVGYTYTNVYEHVWATIIPYTDEDLKERYTLQEQHWNIILGGHYPLITTSMWVVHDGVRYEIERVATTKGRKVTNIIGRVPNI